MPVRREDATTGHAPEVDVHVVTPDRWNDLVQLFERKGPRGGVPIPGHCWCMLWRDEQGPTNLRKAALKATVDQGRYPGLVAYVDGRPVGWVAVAPREDHSRLERSRQYGPTPGDHDVFAVTCLYVDRDIRGAGVASALLDAATMPERRAPALLTRSQRRTSRRTRKRAAGPRRTVGWDAAPHMRRAGSSRSATPASEP